VEAESPRAIASLLRFAGLDEHAANLVEHARISRRIAPRRPADRRLIDLDEFVDLIHAAQTAVRPRFRPKARQPARDGAGQGLVQERTFARAAHPRHANEHAEWKDRAGVLKIIG